MAVGLFVLAYLVRLAFLYPVRDEAPDQDPWDYDHIAWNLAQGHGYSLDGVLPTAYRAPLYPVILGAVYWVFGHSWFAGRLVTAGFSAATASVVFLAGLRLANRPVGLIAGLATVWRTAPRRFSILYVVLLYSQVNALAFYASERLRAGIEPFLFILGLVGAAELWRFVASQPAVERAA